MGVNNLDLVRRTVDHMKLHGIKVWVAGGWAEELRGMRPPGPHEDIDVFVLAQDFSEVERALGEISEWNEIKRKRFSHKRAWYVDERDQQCGCF